MKSDRSITLLKSEVQHFATTPIVVVYTVAGEVHYPISKDFSGILTLDFNEGGLAQVWKKERLK